MRLKRPYEHYIGHEAQALFAWMRLHHVEAKKKFGVDILNNGGQRCNLEDVFLGMARRLRVTMTKVLDEPCGEGTRNEQQAAMYDVGFTAGRPGGALSKKKQRRLAKKAHAGGAKKTGKRKTRPLLMQPMKRGRFTTRGNAIVALQASAIVQAST
jgi:hypothetical protein